MTFQGVTDGLGEGEPGAAVFEPTAVSLRRERAHGSPRNVFEARVRDIRADALGATVELDIGSGRPLYATITAAAVAELGVDVGTVLFAEVKAVQVRLIPTPNHSATGN